MLELGLEGQGGPYALTASANVRDECGYRITVTGLPSPHQLVLRPN